MNSKQQLDSEQQSDSEQQLQDWRERALRVEEEVSKAIIGQGNERLSSPRESHLQSLAQQVGFDNARLERPSSIRRAMQDRRFSRRTLVPTDLSWLPAMAALILLLLRFRPSHLLKLHPLILQSLKWRRAR
jgi:mxaL protein